MIYDDENAQRKLEMQTFNEKSLSTDRTLNDSKLIIENVTLVTSQQ